MKENLYHFTNHTALKSILKNGIHFKQNDLYSNKFKYYYTISTTRNYDFKWLSKDVRIVLDKERIKNEYVIKPIHWKNTSYYHINSPDHRLFGHADIMNQTEERICMNPNDVYRQYFLHPKYIKQIDIIKPTDEKLDNPHNIKINTVDKYKPIKEMKYINTFESYINETNNIINQIKQHKVGDIISNETLYKYTEALHDFNFNNDFISDHILKHDKFILKELYLSDLDLDSVSPFLVSDYKDLFLQNKWYPPIIFDKDDDIIIDGYHRANALFQLGITKILAWVG